MATVLSFVMFHVLIAVQAQQLITLLTYIKHVAGIYVLVSAWLYKHSYY